MRNLYFSQLFHCLKITSHALRFCCKTVINCCSKLEIVFSCLVAAPCFFTVTLGLSKALVFLLQRFKLGILLASVLVLKHSSHTGDGGSLVSVVLCLICESLIVVLMLFSLLSNPLLLLLSLESKTIMIEQILSLKLAAARCKSRDILLWAIKSLASSFHI